MEKYRLPNTLAQFLIVNDFIREIQKAKDSASQKTVENLFGEFEKCLKSKICLYSPGLFIARLFYVFVCTHENSVFEEINTKKCSEFGVTGEHADKQIEYFTRKMRNAVSHYHIKSKENGYIEFYDGTYEKGSTNKEERFFKNNFSYVCSIEEIENVSYNLLFEYALLYAKHNKNK